MKPQNPLPRFEAFYSPEPNTGCWLWTGNILATGYGSLSVNNRPVRAHRFSYRTFVGPVPEGKDVCHSCDVRSCVNPSHLFIGTRRENMLDAKRKRRLATGSRHGQSVLNEPDVQKIKSLLATGVSGISIARKFGVSPMTVSDIKRCVTWSEDAAVQ